MAKQKYYYAIVDKENGNFPIISNKLPIYWVKRCAMESVFLTFGVAWDKFYAIQKIKIQDLENLVLKSKKV